MCKIWIFGGTTEGRLLAEYCSREKIEAWVSVASEYGEELFAGGADGIWECRESRFEPQYLPCKGKT